MSEPIENSLRFRIAPHIVQDLGLNLYTSLPRVLVEFVANAYDADSPEVEIQIDRDRIQNERTKLQADWKLEQTRANQNSNESNSASQEGVVPLELRTLPDSVNIVIEDKGHGMSRSDLQEKFLVAGRRRREAEKTSLSAKGRLLMGRKGLGKLAGFGIAHRVEVVSRKGAEKLATSITLEYNDLVKHSLTEDVKVPTKEIHDDNLLPSGGTKIILSKLVYGPMKSTEGSIANAIGDHFAWLEKDEFEIRLGKMKIVPTPRTFIYAYPKPELSLEEFVPHKLTTEDGTTVSFRYRMRFTGPSQQLTAADQGMRVYAHRRLAAIPSTLDLKTGIHGFRSVHYLDGVVYADFLDDDKHVDYISTDRQSLRWDSALLTPLREFLTKEMELACDAYQKQREIDSLKESKTDKFTKECIDTAKLPKLRKKLAYKISAMLAGVCEGGIKGEEYKTHLKIIVGGLEQGDVLRSLSDLATLKNPKFSTLLHEVTKLTSQEVGDFMRIVQGRLNGIETLKKIVQNVDFKKSDNEKELHKLLEECPWLIDPLFSQLVTSNKTEEVMQQRLAKHLEIAGNVPKKYDPTSVDETGEYKKNERPDLVFLLGSDGGNRIVIVELKAPNTPLHLGHLTQLKRYMRKAKEWLKEQNRADVEVCGYLIGSKDSPQSRSEEVLALRAEIKENMEKSDWRVFDILEILKRTETAHKEFLDAYVESMEEDEDGN